MYGAMRPLEALAMTPAEYLTLSSGFACVMQVDRQKLAIKIIRMIFFIDRKVTNIYENKRNFVPMTGNSSRTATRPVKGRYAPSPSGRMHLGNIFTALLSWLSAKTAGGSWVLRIEDLDPQRSKMEYAKLIEDDLQWLGLEWDEGGLDNIGGLGPYLQSQRTELYRKAFDCLCDQSIVYPCHCTRADIMATQAPHQSDGRVVYQSTCRPSAMPPFPAVDKNERAAMRLFVNKEDIEFDDAVFGSQTVNLARHCGDFIVRRADGAWAYQLAVVVDDALMGISEVVRGCDLLTSAAQQIYLYRLLGYEPPRYAHVPLICNEGHQRLSKRDQSMSVGELRQRYKPQEIIGILAYMAGLIDTPLPTSPHELKEVFNIAKIPAQTEIIVSGKILSL